MRIGLTGGTGPLGRAIIARLVNDQVGPIITMSRDEVRAEDLIGPGLRSYAHGSWDAFDSAEVDVMIREIRDFMEKHFS